MIDRRNAWIFEALDLASREILERTNAANATHPTGVDPLRSYLRALVTSPKPSELREKVTALEAQLVAATAPKKRAPRAKKEATQECAKVMP